MLMKRDRRAGKSRTSIRFSPEGQKVTAPGSTVSSCREVFFFLSHRAECGRPTEGHAACGTEHKVRFSDRYLRQYLLGHILHSDI